MNKTKTRTGLSALFVVLLAIMIAVPAILQSGADAAVNRKQPTKATLMSAKATSYNKVSLKWKKSKNITSYAVYYKASNSKKWVKIANVSSKKTGYTHKSSKKYPLKQGKTYQYRIRGYNKKAKGSKKYGKYSSVKKVKVPKKPAAKPTEAPKPTIAPKPTAVPKPTAAPKPTATPKPKPTAIPKPTQIPQPTKPATVKVTGITLNPSSMTLTSKSKVSKITASVSPSNSTNKNISWTSSNTDVATISTDGTVTAKANGSATIYATANDGSGVKGSCQVTVNIPSYVTENVSLAGGRSKSFTIYPELLPKNGNLNNVTFEFKSSDNSCYFISHGALYDAYGASSNAITVTKKGTISVVAKYGGTIIKVWNVTITSDWTEYFNYYNWRVNVEGQIWNDNMTDTQKLRAAEAYIKTHFGYVLGYSKAITIYNKGYADCIGASDLMGGFANDIGSSIKVSYYNQELGQEFDYLVDAGSASGGHIYCHIYANGKWDTYDASNLA